MNLLYRITFRISIALLVLFAVWGTLFYYIIIDEINDETDDALEDYSEYIITRALMGESLPEKDNGSNNSYYMVEVSSEYADRTPKIRYSEEMVYLHSKKETEPARIYKTIFKDREGHFFELTVMIPTIEKDDLKETILFWIVLLYVALLLAIIIINAIVLRRSLRPLYTILDWINELSLTKETPPLDIRPDITEFHKLADALLRSAQRNAEVYEQQSRFIGHASHELQTPIAIIQNRLEMLVDEPNLTEPQLIQIAKACQTLNDLSRLNKTLLLLAKIENKQFPESGEIHINQTITALLAGFSEAYEYKGINLRIEENAQLHIRMNDTLASVLFNNLIKNAYIHNFPKGEITITINTRSIVFSNTSESEALNPEHIFKYFYQNSKKEGSSGLGLALVKSIAQLYSLEVSYHYEDGRHRFAIRS